MKNVLILWEGLPSCSLLISELSQDPQINVDLAFTRPNVPFEDLSNSLDVPSAMTECSPST